MFPFRLLDELLFPGYRRMELKDPIFIISNPRSGTTYMHRLFCLDEERYTYTLMYHTIFTSITLIKLIEFARWVDKGIGRPLGGLRKLIDKYVFGGWEKIHPTGLTQSEEDEGMFIFPMISTAICLICPFMQEFKYLTVPDRMSVYTRKRLQQFYESSFRRFAYATGRDRYILSKNVNSIGRIKTVLEIMPNAKVIYLIRDPRRAVPSFISMFRAPWKLHSPELKKTGPEHRALGQIAIDFYKYFEEVRPTLNQDNLYVVPYTDLVSQPMKTVVSIYDHFKLPKSEGFLQRLEQETNKTRKYKSQHSYSLEEYGITEEYLISEIGPIMDKYGLLHIEQS
ncbi:MAG: sulfotransferase [Bacteroidota bacterium]